MGGTTDWIPMRRLNSSISSMVGTWLKLSSSCSRLI